MTFRSTKGASKQRRDQINSMILQLRELLPLPETTRQRLSQLQVMSAVCVYVRKSNYFRHMCEDNMANDLQNEFVQSLPGFILVVSKDGKLVYISENVTDFLGHSMVDMMTQGDTLWDIVDSRDHAAVQAQLHYGGNSSEVPNEENGTTFFCRMNVARTLRRQCSFREQKVMAVRGHFMSLGEGATGAGAGGCPQQPLFFALCSPLLTPEVKENMFRATTDVLWLQHSPDMRIQACSQLVESYLGYSEDDLIGKSWYELLHPQDLNDAKNKHIKVMGMSHEMGVMLTTRLQTASGSWQCTSSVLCMQQQEEGANRILSVHALIREEELSQFTQQCEQYSRQAAQVSQYMSLPAGGMLPYLQHQTQTRGALGYPAYDLRDTAALRNMYTGNTGQMDGYMTDYMPDTHVLQRSVPASNTMMPRKEEMLNGQMINRLKRKLASPPDCMASKLPHTWLNPDMDDSHEDFCFSALATTTHNSLRLAQCITGSRYVEGDGFVVSGMAPTYEYNKAALLHSEFPPTPEGHPADRDMHDVLSGLQHDSLLTHTPRMGVHSPGWMPPTPSPQSPGFSSPASLVNVKAEPISFLGEIQLPQLKADDISCILESKTAGTLKQERIISPPTDVYTTQTPAEMSRATTFRSTTPEDAVAASTSIPFEGGVKLPLLKDTDLDWLEGSMNNAAGVGDLCRTGVCPPSGYACPGQSHHAY